MLNKGFKLPRTDLSGIRYLSYRKINIPGYSCNSIQMMILARCNMIKVFNHNTQDYSNARKTIYRRYIKASNKEKFVKNFKEFVNTFKSNGATGVINVLRYICKYPSVQQFIHEIYDSGNTRTLATELNLEQRTAHAVVTYLGINRHFRGNSKQHKRLKPIVEKYIGSTLTEFYIKPYRVDEYSINRKLAIEFDAEKLHNVIKDTKRDNYLLSLGIKVLRIPSFCSNDECCQIMECYLLNA